MIRKKYKLSHKYFYFYALNLTTLTILNILIETSVIGKGIMNTKLKDNLL